MSQAIGIAIARRKNLEIHGKLEKNKIGGDVQQ
jgi:hypothetical protein